MISDTHGLLRPEVHTHLSGCEQIIHGGDIGGANILEHLSRIAPVTAVRGNNDTAAWARALGEHAIVECASTRIYVLHDLAHLTIDVRAAGIDIVIAGHSHKPAVARRDGVLFINPGSAGPRRFKLPATLALLEIEGADACVRVIDLETNRLFDGSLQFGRRRQLIGDGADRGAE